MECPADAQMLNRRHRRAACGSRLAYALKPHSVPGRVRFSLGAAGRTRFALSCESTAASQRRNLGFGRLSLDADRMRVLKVAGTSPGPSFRVGGAVAQRMVRSSDPKVDASWTASRLLPNCRDQNSWDLTSRPMLSYGVPSWPRERENARLSRLLAIRFLRL